MIGISCTRTPFFSIYLIRWRILKILDRWQSHQKELPLHLFLGYCWLWVTVLTEVLNVWILIREALLQTVLPTRDLRDLLMEHNISFKSFRNFFPLIQYKKKFMPLLVVYNLNVIWKKSIELAYLAGVSLSTKVKYMNLI